MLYLLGRKPVQPDTRVKADTSTSKQALFCHKSFEYKYHDNILDKAKN